MAKKVIDQVEVTGQRVLMRVDYNVPMEGDVISDDRRIRQSLESVRSVVDRGGKLVLMSHLGRPKGNGVEPEFSLAPIARLLGTLLQRDVTFAADCIGTAADKAVAAMKNGGVLLLENLRFRAAETLIDSAKKNPEKRPTAEQQAAIESFSAGLARHADIYCNNAFGTCHRKHVSMYDVPMRLGAGRRVCGHLVQKELKFLGEATTNPRRPFVAILGGAKVSDKIGVIERLLPRVDAILIGGAMSYTFYAAMGLGVGASLCERDKIDLARGLLDKAGTKLQLPQDSVCAAKLEAGAATSTHARSVPEGLMGLDIGPATAAAYAKQVESAATVLWNGPMGVFETPPFDAGTLAVARAMAKATQRGATTIVGGGDSAAAVDAAGLAESMSHISTGGGASLEYLERGSFATLDLLDEA